MQDDNKDINEYLDNLPEELKAAISSIDYQQKLQEVAKNNKLMIDQVGKLETETTLVLTGIEPLDKYVENLINNGGFSKIQASIIAHDVNELIFKGVRDALKNLNDEIAEDEKAEEKTPAPTKEFVLSGVEQPHTTNEPSVSFSSLPSNKPEVHEEIDRGVEIRVDHLPEVAPKIDVPMVSSIVQTPKPISEPLHLNIPPVKNIVETKLNEIVTTPKQTIVAEEKTKLPEKNMPKSDPYRESF